MKPELPNISRYYEIDILFYRALVRQWDKSCFISVGTFKDIESAKEHYPTAIRLITEVPELVEKRRMKYKLEWQEAGYEIINE